MSWAQHLASEPVMDEPTRNVDSWDSRGSSPRTRTGSSAVVELDFGRALDLDGSLWAVTSGHWGTTGAFSDTTDRLEITFCN